MGNKSKQGPQNEDYQTVCLCRLWKESNWRPLSSGSIYPFSFPFHNLS